MKCYFKDCKKKVIGTKTNRKDEKFPVCLKHYELLWNILTPDEKQEASFHKFKEVYNEET